MDSALKVIFSAVFVSTILRVSTPLILPALGGLIAELSGASNIALEGMMLTSACAGVLVSVYTHSEWLGLLAGISLAEVMALILGYFHLKLKADIILVGLALNILASGATIFVVYLLTGDKGSSTKLVSLEMPTITIPIIKDIPFLGEVLSGQNLITYLAFIATGLVWLFLYRTRLGIHIRAVGENPDAARSVGINVSAMRYLALMLSALLAALGGIHLSMGYVKFFQRDMTSGRGFIALAAVYLGAKHPVGTLIAALVFGAADALSIQLGNLNIPSQLVQMIPPVVTVVSLILYAIARKRRAAMLQRRFQKTSV